MTQDFKTYFAFTPPPLDCPDCYSTNGRLRLVASAPVSVLPGLSRFQIGFFAVLVWCLQFATPGLGQTTRSPALEPSASPVNVIVILVDDMGIMDCSVPFLGEPLRPLPNPAASSNRAQVRDSADQPSAHQPLNQLYRTPNLERLAAQGVRFNQFYAMSVCSPSRVSIMTGQYAARHHTTNWINPTENNRGPHGPTDWNWQGLNRDHLTLPRILQRQGYRTIHVGKAHFGPWNTVGADPLNLGFDVNIAGSPIGHPGSYLAAKKYGAGTSHAVPHLEAFHESGQFLTAALTQAACQQISESVRIGKPFFLNLCHYAVHSPFESDERFAADYAATKLTPAAQAFATLVAGVDHSLGQVLDHLHQLDIARNTLIIFLGDNGTDAPLGGAHEIACAAPLRGKKGSHYEGGMRVPFVVAWAQPQDDLVAQQRISIRRGALQSQVASVVDLLPTIVEVTQSQLDPNAVIDGRSLTELFSGAAVPSRPQEFLMHYPHEVHRSNHFTVWRENQWKLIYHYFPGPQSKGARYQLFDLDHDPSESNDLATTQPEQLRHMVTRMQQKLDACQAQFPEETAGTPLEIILPPQNND